MLSQPKCHALYALFGHPMFYWFILYKLLCYHNHTATPFIMHSFILCCIYSDTWTYCVSITSLPRALCFIQSFYVLFFAIRTALPRALLRTRSFCVVSVQTLPNIMLLQPHCHALPLRYWLTFMRNYHRICASNLACFRRGF